MDQWEQSPVGTILGTVAGQLMSRPVTDDTLFRHSVVVPFPGATIAVPALVSALICYFIPNKQAGRPAKYRKLIRSVVLV